MIAALRYWPYIAIAVLVAALGVGGALLRQAWQGEATAQANAAQYKQAAQEQSQQYEALLAQQKQNEKIISDAEAAKARLRDRADKLSQQLRNAPDASKEYTACRDVLLPSSVIERLREQSGSGASNDQSDASE